MPKSNEDKLVEIKQHSFELYNKVKFGDISVQDAYNQMGRELIKVKEFKGEGTKGKNKIGLKAEFDRLHKMYKPTLKQYLDVIKQMFPFTFDRDIEDYLKK
tara:strand:+ start:477 stop:779 length:303 start_codon:yes stop_codon:yes gene_type:complete